MKQVHIVPHMHWDREWYFSTEESRILLVNNMAEIMTMLETNPDYPYYVLDGQTAVLDDYFAAKPDMQERMRKLVQQGKLIIGPWFTQTDEMVVGAESIVRNLLYGFKDCESFGPPMMIGYLPDSFGQSAQMPQILNGFGIQHAIFWRGISERHGTDKTEFHWASADGSRVLVQLMPLGYAIGKYLPEDEAKLKERMDKYLAVLDRGATTEHILLPNGHDQMPIQKNIFTVMEKLRKLYPDRSFFLSRYEQLLAEVAKNPGLPTLRGEFIDGKYMRVHRSIYSTRMDIKAANARIEGKITNVLEPLATIAYSLGFEYHHGLVELIWKQIMQNHAHDSIGCCCSDKVHQEIMSRFYLAEERADQLIRFYERRMVDAIDTAMKGDRLTAFNLLPYERDEAVTASVISKLKAFKLVDEQSNELPFEVIASEIMDPGLIDRQIVHYGDYDPFIKYTIQFRDRLPAMGYMTYFVAPADRPAGNSLVARDLVETDYYQITVNPNGTLKIFDKQLNREFDQVLRLENGGDDGDEYDYSPLPGETLLYSDQVRADVDIRQNAYGAVIQISYALPVPEDAESRQKGLIDSTVDVDITVTVPQHKPVLSVRFDLENHAKDHRVRALIPTGIAASFSLADNQFGVIQRPVYDDAMTVWQAEKWDERPDAIFPMLTFVSVSDDQVGVSVLTNSTREYEIVGERCDTIAVTLFRSIGFLGKEELVRRPGRPSGIKLPTPDSQMLGGLTIEFGITTHARSALRANVARTAKEYLTPIQCYNKIPHDAMKLNPAAVRTPVQYSLLREVQPSVVLSTLKKAEKADAYVLRCYNATDEAKKADFAFLGPVTAVKAANLNEQPGASLQVASGQVQVTVKPNQVQTILFER